MRCGANIPAHIAATSGCEDCQIETMFMLVTETNGDKLPFPTHLKAQEIDFEDPSKNCQCRPGTCPCGKFVAHSIDEPCNTDDFSTEESKAKELAEQIALSKEYDKRMQGLY